MALLCEEGDNVLLPRPCFATFTTICKSLGVEVKFYDLHPEQNWQADLDQMRALIDSKTKAILVNNPANPSGLLFSLEH
jgi:tyrosine aminotransferase